MYQATFAFLCGMCCPLYFSHMPALRYLIPICVALIFLKIFLPRFQKISLPRLNHFIHPLLFFSLGLLWITFTTTQQLQKIIPTALEDERIWIEGDVISLPEGNDDYQRFIFQTNTLNVSSKVSYKDTQRLLRLSVYHPSQNPTQKIQPGDHCRLLVSLKRPRGFANPGNFDLEKWLFAQGISATGSIIQNRYNHCFEAPPHTRSILHLRATLQQKIRHALTSSPMSGLIEALAIGTNNIATDIKSYFMLTGTSHLLVISGLHIALCGAFFYWLFRITLAAIPALSLRVAAPRLGGIVAILVSAFYCAIASFTVPVVRSLIVIICFLLSQILCRQITVWRRFAYSLITCLIVYPLSILDIGFWLSFLAVFILIICLTGRSQMTGMYVKHVRPQLGIIIGMMPITLLFFQRFSLVSLIANLIMIPYTTFFLVPIILLGSFLILFNIHLGEFLLQWSAIFMSYSIRFLKYLSQLPLASVTYGFDNLWQWHWMSVAAILLLLPRAWPARHLAWLWLLPVFWTGSKTLKPQEVMFSLLDVGQGLSAIIQTQHHVLIYDAGPKFGPDLDAGVLVIEPFLIQQHIASINMLMVSHGDSDHSGGAARLIHDLKITNVLASEPQQFPNLASRCEAGMEWYWDGVHFSILHPNPRFFAEDNNGSCVLKIDNGSTQILLTGDIERQAEWALVVSEGQHLRSSILIAPHHGSKTSSTDALIKSVQPQYVLFSTGYLNKFHFPNESVLERYQQHAVNALTTADCGMIRFNLTANSPPSSTNTILKPDCYRKLNQHFWQGP